MRNLLVGLLAISIMASLCGCAGQQNSIPDPQAQETIGASQSSNIQPVSASKVKSAETVYTDINETNLNENSRLLERIIEKDTGPDANFLCDGRIDVVDANGYDHQAMVYYCQGAESYTKPFRDYITGLKTAYSDDYGQIAGYRNVTWDNTGKSYSNQDIDFLVIQTDTLTDGNGHSYEATIVACDGSEQFTAKKSELHSKFFDEFYEDTENE